MEYKRALTVLVLSVKLALGGIACGLKERPIKSIQPPQKIVAMGDIHYCQPDTPYKLTLERAVERANQEDPDLVMLTGDLLNADILEGGDCNTCINELKEKLLEIESEKIYLLGNHDIAGCVEELNEALDLNHYYVEGDLVFQHIQPYAHDQFERYSTIRRYGGKENIFIHGHAHDKDTCRKCEEGVACGGSRIGGSWGNIPSIRVIINKKDTIETYLLPLIKNKEGNYLLRYNRQTINKKTNSISPVKGPTTQDLIEELKKRVS